MKKLFIAAMILVATGSSAFALDATKVSNKVRTSFNVLFAGAQDVAWNSTENYNRATFVLDDENMEAFFSTEGELIGTSHKVDAKYLPSKGVKTIKKKYPSYKITDSIEFDRNGDITYYVSVEDGAKKQILEVSIFGAVSVYTGATK